MNLRSIIRQTKMCEALLQADTPLTTRDFHLLLPDLNERTLRRWIAKLEQEGCLTQRKGGRGYKKGVTWTIMTIDRKRVKQLQQESGLASEA